MSEPTAHTVLDQAYFEQLFKTHYVHLCNYAHQYVRDWDSAKDITQKVYINLWENRTEIDPQKSLQSYLFTAVRNRCLNYMRDQKKYRSRVLDLELMESDIPFMEDNRQLKELQEKISAAVSDLPEKCRLVFEMSRYRDMKYQDIAAELDISVKTVEAHMSRALKGLREKLQAYLHLLWILFAFFS